MKKSYLSAFVCALLLFSCGKEELNTPSGNELETNTSKSLNTSPEELLRSVALVYNSTSLSNSEDEVINLRIVQFATNWAAPKKISINGINFSDTGEGNDLKANDGIYTSDITINPGMDSEILVQTSDEHFSYQNELDEWISFFLGGPTAGYSCDLSLVTCSETNWWNDCWFGSPCTCIEADCNFTVGWNFF